MFPWSNSIDLGNEALTIIFEVGIIGFSTVAVMIINHKRIRNNRR